MISDEIAIPSPIHHRLYSLFQSKLARASAWLFIGSVASGVFGYVFQVIMGRMLSTQEYGLFSALMAVFAILGAPSSTLMMVISRKVSEYRARQDIGSLSHFFKSMHLKTTIAVTLALALCLLGAPQAQTYLKTADSVPIYLLGVLLFVSFFPLINNAFLQGLQKFNWLSAGTAVGTLSKIFFSALIVSLGYGVSGALAGTILSTIVTLVLTAWGLRKVLSPGRGLEYQSAHLALRPVIPVLVANIAFTAMTQLDLILVNYFFSPHSASLYAAAAILGKAVMYLPGGITLALFPMVAENEANGKPSAHLLGQAIALTVLLCGAGAIFYFFAGEFLIAKLYGESYREAGQILKYYGFAILPMALVMIAEHFLIAKGRVLFAYLFVLISPFQLFMIYHYHESPTTVVAVMGASGTVLAIIGYALLWRASRAGLVKQ